MFQFPGYDVENVLGKEVGPLAVYVRVVTRKPALWIGLEEISLWGCQGDDINPQASAGSKDLNTRLVGLSQFGLPPPPDPLLKASLTASGCAGLQEDKVLFVLMICEPEDQELTAQG